MTKYPLPRGHDTFFLRSLGAEYSVLGPIRNSVRRGRWPGAVRDAGHRATAGGGS